MVVSQLAGKVITLVTGSKWLLPLLSQKTLLLLLSSLQCFKWKVLNPS